jgi:hypothetical protein
VSLKISLAQNVGIATSLALTMFRGAELNDAMGVPFLYGLAEIFFIGIYCVIAWKLGWTKAPPNESIWKVISTSYEVGEGDEENDEAKQQSARTAEDDSDDGKSKGGDTAMTSSEMLSP